MSSVLGVDGWRGRWIGALVDDDGTVTWEVFESAAAVLIATADLIAVDIPMGLVDSGTRRCDELARAELPPAARSSVFSAPPRIVLDCPDYSAARQVLSRHGGPLMSAQAFGIKNAVKSFDDLLAADPSRQQRVIEVHPELSFRRLAGRSDLPPKKTAAGVAARIIALASWLPDVLGCLHHAPPGVPADDALDALACAYTARRHLAGSSDRLTDSVPDRCGLTMQIVVPRP